ncbi:polyprenyl synthetase family protein [Kistimonas asteriae]|uniref:polyprenyl synthetase family protein n=1 Tax=Kistimonas asteriae TaxID=517724 RepID=UPI001BADED13|nr:farnesyl diphosphate synthase [Kistimonas asteriae]
MDIKQYIQTCRQWADNGLEQVFARYQPAEARLHEAMKYSVFNGGKRIRPMLVRAACEALGGTAQTALPGACAVELIHAYSLVHDDLPAMDDDDLRRGQPTCHKAFDEATAILAGDALQSLAFEALTHPELTRSDTLAADYRLQQVTLLARAAGNHGMAAGQSLDMQGTGNTLTLSELETLHRHKTGALIEASVTLGALSAGIMEPAEIKPLQTYAHAIGLAFQVQDDILDVTASTATLGKQQGADVSLGKNTYVSLLGLDAAREKADLLRDEALTALQDMDERAAPLRLLADYIVSRHH